MPKTVRKLFTTGQVARLIGVATKTISKWIDAGKISGVFLLDGGDRRVHRDALKKFLTEQGYHWALEELEQEEMKASQENLAATDGATENQHAHSSEE